MTTSTIQFTMRDLNGVVVPHTRFVITSGRQSGTSIPAEIPYKTEFVTNENGEADVVLEASTVVPYYISKQDGVTEQIISYKFWVAASTTPLQAELLYVDLGNRSFKYNEASIAALIEAKVVAINAANQSLQVVSLLGDVNTIRDNLSSLITVAPNISSVNTVATNISAVNAVGPAVSNVATVAGNITDVSNVAGSIDSVNAIADSVGNIDTVSNSITAVNTVATNVSPVNTVASNIAAVQATAIGIGSIPEVMPYVSNIATVANNIEPVIAVGNNIDNINDVRAMEADIEVLVDNIASLEGAAAAVTQAVDARKELFEAGEDYTADVATYLELDYFPIKSNSVKVFINGLYQNSDTWSRVGKTLSFTSPLVDGFVEVQYEVPSAFVGLDADDTAVLVAAQNAAQASANAAAQSFDNFDDRYLGAKNVAPIVDNDGNALITGSMYFNSSEGKMYVRNSNATWQLTTADAEDVNYLPVGTGAVVRDVQSKLRESISVADFGALGNGVADDTAAIQKAIDYVSISGGVVYIPTGTYITSYPLVVPSSGVSLVGESIWASTIKASTSFSGTSILVLGQKSVATVTLSVNVSDLKVDCNSVAGVGGIEMYGVRDGSSLRNVYVYHSKTFSIFTNIAGNGTGLAAGLMNQGVMLDNVFSVTFDTLSSVSSFDLNGIFESTLINCKALGSGSTPDASAVGFDIGRISQSRGVRLYNCSVGNLGNGTSSTNCGIRYGELAQNCSDEFTTLENIYGIGVYFDGGVSACAICVSKHPRVFPSSTLTILNPIYKFRNSTSCSAGPVVYSTNTKVWFRFESPGVNNYGYLEAGLATNTITDGSSIVSFDALASGSNAVTGITGDSTANRQRFFYSKSGQGYEFYDNGASLEFLTTGTTLRMGVPNSFAITDSSGSILLQTRKLSGAKEIGFFGSTPVGKPILTGAKGGNTALSSLLTALSNLGLITDSTT